MSGIDEGRLDKSIDEACLLLYFGKDLRQVCMKQIDAYEASRNH